MVASAALLLSETEAAQVVSLERKWVLVLIGCPRTLSVASEAAVSLLVVWLRLLLLSVLVVGGVFWSCGQWKVHDLPESLGAVRELVLVESVVGGRDEICLCGR